MLKTVLTLALLGASLYGLLLLLLAIGQDRFIFQRSPLPADYTFQFDHPFEELMIDAGSANISALFFCRPDNSRGAVLYFHGNRGTLRHWGWEHRTFTQLGYNLLMIDYRGYGKSSGRPSEAGLYEDGEAALQWLLNRYPPSEIVLFGRSLGSGVAARLAAMYKVRLLILETPYDRLSNVVRSKVPVPLPDRLLRHDFPTEEWLPQAQCPAYVIAGGQDKLIAPQLSRRLQPLLKDPAHYFLIEGGGHANLSAFAEYHFQLRHLLAR
jgi:uncharacterized protein